MKLKTSDIVYIALGTALTSVGGIFLKFPSPFSPVNFTMQTLFVIFFPLVIGKKAVWSQIAYVLLGLIGVPVFTQGGGISYVFQPSFGYLLSFIVASLFLGAIVDKLKENGKFNVPRAILYGIVALCIIYVLGTAYMYVILNVYMGKAYTIGAVIMMGVTYYIPMDVASVVVAAFVAKAIDKAIRKRA